MKLIVNIDKEKEEYEINKKEELIDVIKDYTSLFLPIDDDYAYEMFQEGKYNNLIDDLKLYQEDKIKYYEAKFNKPKVVEEIKERNKNINKLFILLGEVERLNDLNDIINELDVFNNLFNKAGLEFVFSIK